MLLTKKSLCLFCLSLLVFQGLYAQKNLVAGKVTDNYGRPVPSASVRIKETLAGTASDMQGAFSLHVKAGDSLMVSAVGFGDTTFLAGSSSPLVIVLLPKQTSLHEAVVTGTAPATDAANPMAATSEQIITDAFQDYIRNANFSNGQYHSSSLVTAQGQTKMVNTNVSGFGALNTLNTGEMLPELKHQEDTKGSRYLIKGYAYGVVVDNTGKITADSVHLLNYDKIEGQLMIAMDAGNYLAVDKEKVLAFAFKTPDTSFVFLNVPLLSKVNYFILIATGPRYSAYKSIRTKFTKANYVSNGLTESGNNYDEYVDTQTYFWVAGKDSAGIFELKKKSIKAAFANEKDRVDAYFSKHRLDDIDDHFVKGLVDSLNEPK
jgi:CarboxypepD_reg-like domain